MLGADGSGQSRKAPEGEQTDRGSGCALHAVRILDRQPFVHFRLSFLAVCVQASLQDEIEVWHSLPHLGPPFPSASGVTSKAEPRIAMLVTVIIRPIMV
jgi:hypothetical protein